MATFTGNDTNETIFGSTSADTLSGGFGNDTFFADDGADLIYGEALINPLTSTGTDTGASRATLSVINNTSDTLYIYAVDVSGSIYRVGTVEPGATYTENAWINATRVVGNVDGTEFYRFLKTSGTAAGTVTLNSANDTIVGGLGNDSIYGQVGADVIMAGDGDDVVEGGTGADTIQGDAGNDVINAGDGNDNLSGGVGNDTIAGGNGADTITGDAGLDVIHGGAGNDTVYAGDDADSVSGDGGNDQLSGGLGNDTLEGSVGADTIYGDGGADLIDGGADDDRLFGHFGDDTIYGGGDNDYIDGASENDRLFGNSGNDTILGGTGTDVLEGGIGNDSLSGGDQNDTIYGDAANPAGATDDIAITAGASHANNVSTPNLDDSASNVNPGSIQAFTANGQTYVVTTSFAYDGYADVYQVNDDGSLTKTGSMRYQDATGTVTINGTTTLTPGSTLAPAFGNGIVGTEIATVGGKTTLFMASQNGAGITAWEVNGSGGLVYKGAIHFGGSQPSMSGGIAPFNEVYTTSTGKVYVYATRDQNDFISRFEYSPSTGTFTEDTSFHVNTADRPADITSFSTANGNFMAVANGTGVQIFAVDANGGLTAVASETATSQSGFRADVTVYTKPDGTIYLSYSNTNADEVTLYKVGADGSLTPSDSLIGQGDNAAMLSTVSYINGEPIIVVSDISGDAIRLYSISSECSFVLETEISGAQAGFTVDAKPPIIVKSPNGSYYLVDGTTGTTIKLNFTLQTGADHDTIDGGLGNDLVFGQAGDDSILGNSGDDVLDGGQGDDTVRGGDGLDSVVGGDGNDRLYGDAGIDTLVGGLGDDLIYGGTENDLISGGDGNDRAYGEDGDDSLDGGAGNDSMDGGIGVDTLRGGDGLDSLVGGDNNDILDGGAGADTLSGGAGDDSMSGGADNDAIYGDAGLDTIYGDAGNDYISGGLDADTVYGGSGADTILGDAGNDLLDGGTENDTLDGGDGNDSVFGGAGSDLLDGGAGTDTLYGFGTTGTDDNSADTLRGGAGADQLYGGGGNDSLDGGTENDNLYGGSGNDSMFGGAGSDVVDGGAGNDTLYGFGTTGTDDNSADTLLGGAGADQLYGGGGNDSLDGGADNDTLNAGAGDDTLLGGTGTDSLSGGAGRDRLDGGSDADTLAGGDGFDTFIAGDQDTISDFNTAAGQELADKNQANNDFVDLSSYYNQTNLDIYNANVAPGEDTYGNPLAWMRADQAKDGILNQAGITLTIRNGGYAVGGTDLTYDNTNVICFGADAMIRTANGDVAAGELSVGDLVETRDAGLQAIRWVGQRVLDAATLAANPKLRPIRIKAGALGAGLPEADLIVSPQHRMLVRSKIAQKMFGAMEVLVAAKQLCRIEGIEVAEDLDSVTYVHFLCDAHQIVWANGSESESLFTGAEALRSVGPAAVAEIFAIFPELAYYDHQPVPARELVSGRLGRKLAVRHAQNAKPLLG